MTSATTWWPLEHERSLTGRIRVTQGPHTTLLTEGDLDDMLRRVQRTTSNGTARRSGVTLDESQLLDLRATYFPKQKQQDARPRLTGDPDDDAHTLEQARQAQAVHAVGGPDRAEF